MRSKIQLLMLLSLVALCSCMDKKTSQGVEEDTRSEVRLSSVTERMIPQTYEYTATVEPDLRNNIAPSTRLRLERVLVEIGDFVKKNQQLAIMDTSNSKQLKLQLDNELAEFQRIDELYKVGGISKSEWEAVKVSLDVLQTAYSNLLENTSLLSPISGVVSARNYDSGDMYRDGTPILTIEKISPVKLLVSIPEGLYTKIAKKQHVKISLDVYSDEVFDGYVSIVYPTINPDTRTFNVEVKLENKDGRVRPGMFARVEFNYGEISRVVVPDLAIVKQVGSGERYVYVYNEAEGKVTYNKIELGRRLGSEYELISGVPNNAQVVVAGQSSLSNGAKVKVLK